MERNPSKSRSLRLRHFLSPSEHSDSPSLSLRSTSTSSATRRTLSLHGRPGDTPSLYEGPRRRFVERHSLCHDHSALSFPLRRLLPSSPQAGRQRLLFQRAKVRRQRLPFHHGKGQQCYTPDTALAATAPKYSSAALRTLRCLPPRQSTAVLPSGHCGDPTPRTLCPRVRR